MSTPHAPGALLRASGVALLKVILFVALFVVLGAALGWLLVAPLRRLELALGVVQLAGSVIALLAILGATLVMVYAVDRRTMAEVGLGASAARPALLARGLLLGALAIGVPAALLIAARWLRLEQAPDGSWLAAAARTAVVLLPAALFEEVMVRGYPFAALRAAWGWPAALVVTSVVFGLLHLRNPGVTPEAIGLVMLAGIFLGGVLVATGSLYAAWMAHFAWNWTMAALLHVAVSGLGFATPDYRLVDAGPDWLTGGPWGPEGGAGAAAGMVAGLLYLYTRRARREEP